MAITTIVQRYSDNIAPSATASVDSGTADTDYPIANAVDYNPAKPVKLTTTTGSFLFDFGVATRQDVVALIHHNLTAGLNVRYQMNATNAWGAPTVDAAFTIPAYREDLYPVNPFIDLTGVSGYSASGFRYGRVKVTGTNAAAVAIGEIVIIGTKRTMSLLNGTVEVSEERKIVEHSTDYGVATIFDLGVTIRHMKGRVTNTAAQLSALESQWRSSRGRALPWLLVPDSTVNDAWFVRWSDAMKVIAYPDISTKAQFPFAVDEVGRGLYL
jgi:hypothetical protein